MVAEGVETDAIWQQMRDLGADEIQGFRAGSAASAGGGADLVGCVDRKDRAARVTSDHPLLREALHVGMGHPEKFRQQPGVVLAVAGRAAIDRAADVGRGAR